MNGISSSYEHLWGAESARYAGRSAKQIFWRINDDGTVLSAGTNYCAFWTHRLPVDVRGLLPGSNFRFIDDEGEVVFPEQVRIACLVGDELRVYAKELHRGEWELERTLRLPEATHGLPGRKEGYFGRTAKIVTAGKEYVVLTPAEETWLFSVRRKTMQVEREHSRNRLAGEVYPYELRTAPLVDACVDQFKRVGRGRCSHICVCN
ncbi:hypothetical protein ACP70R_006637 [Stipagrostis hirtigluma subsp. patula]